MSNIYIIHYILIDFHRYIENGSLTDILQNFGAFPEALVAFYTQQLLQGLAHVHDKGLIHRDIKASNVLVGKDGVIKLSVCT